VTVEPPWPPAADIVAEMEQTVLGTVNSRSAALASGAPAWTALIAPLAKSNLRQWDLEDTTRDPAASDTDVASAKRHIDHLNADRHRLISEIDGAIAAVLDQVPTAPLATESPGMVLDRLSVLVIRRARTSAASGHDPRQAARVLASRVLAVEAQIGALSLAWDAYIAELRAGARRFFRYESLKLYGSAAAPVSTVKQ
jgi:hypothetical protein